MAKRCRQLHRSSLLGPGLRRGTEGDCAYCATTGSNTALAPTLPCWIVTVAFL